MPDLRESGFNDLADKLSIEMRSQKGAPAAFIQERINDNRLAWFYMTNGKQVPLPVTRPFMPNGPQIEEQSRDIEWRGQNYYEAVSQIDKNRNLHVGFYAGPVFDLSDDMMSSQVPFLAALGLVLTSMLVTVGLYLISVGRPCESLISFFKKKDSGISGLKLPPLSGAVSEILTLKKLLDVKDRTVEDNAASLKEKESRLRNLNIQYERDMQEAKKEKTVLFLKEAENQFLDKLTAETDSKTTARELAETLLRGLNAEFPNSVEFALFFSRVDVDENVLLAHIGFNSNPAEVYKGLSVMRRLPEMESEIECTIVDASSIQEAQFREISEITTARQVILCPLTHLQRRLATLVIFFRGQPQSLEHIIRVLNRAAAITAKTLFHIAVYEEHIESARTDQLTGYRNKTYLSHLLPQLLEHTADLPEEERVFSFFLLEGHDVMSINEKYGRPAGDVMIQELGRRIEKLLQQRRNETLGGWGDYLIRYQGAQFLIVLHSVDSKKATIFAQRLRQVIDTHEWPCGIAKWSTSIGISSFPEDTKNPEEILVNVETALSYARGQSDRNKIAHVSQVPKAFRSAKLAANLGGSLDVFDPAALLQSLSISRKSGVLTVTHPDGKQFWCFLDNGRPTKARLGKFGGNVAIVEFLVLFESGDFSFTDMQSVDKQTVDDIRKLEKSFDVSGSLERTLMDGALAHDHFSWAKGIIKALDLFVWPHPATKSDEYLNFFRAKDDAPSPEEEKAMKDIVKLANGRIQLKVIFDRLDGYPTHTLWRAAALLVSNDFINLKKLATSIGV